MKLIKDIRPKTLKEALEKINKLMFLVQHIVKYPKEQCLHRQIIQRYCKIKDDKLEVKAKDLWVEVKYPEIWLNNHHLSADNKINKKNMNNFNCSYLKIHLSIYLNHIKDISCIITKF